jgi:hypothetical protein
VLPWTTEPPRFLAGVAVQDPVRTGAHCYSNNYPEPIYYSFDNENLGNEIFLRRKTAFDNGKMILVTLSESDE